jgi:hypothetical protein
MVAGVDAQPGFLKNGAKFPEAGMPSWEGWAK